MNDRTRLIALLAVTLTAASAVMYCRMTASGESWAPTGYELTIDLNTATAVELSRLPGIGPALAAGIIDHRQRRGGFESVGELESVPGIGPARLKAIASWVTIRSRASAHRPAGAPGGSADRSDPAGSVP